MRQRTIDRYYELEEDQGVEHKGKARKSTIGGGIMKRIKEDKEGKGLIKIIKTGVPIAIMRQTTKENHKMRTWNSQDRTLEVKTRKIINRGKEKGESSKRKKEIGRRI